MDLVQRDLQNYGKLFPNLKLVFEILAKNRNFFKQIARSGY